MLAKDPALRPTLTQVRSVVTGLRTSTSSQRAATVRIGPRLLKKKTIHTTITVIAAISVLAAGAMLGVTISSKISTRSHNIQTPLLHPSPPHLHPL
jgi:2-methylaconitate cis-trans-isomerase PrpF